MKRDPACWPTPEQFVEEWDARTGTHADRLHLAERYITNAQEAERARRLDRTVGALHRRAEAAEGRLAKVEALLLCSSIGCPCGGERASVPGDELREVLRGAPSPEPLLSSCCYNVGKPECTCARKTQIPKLSPEQMDMVRAMLDRIAKRSEELPNGI